MVTLLKIMRMARKGRLSGRPASFLSIIPFPCDGKRCVVGLVDGLVLFVLLLSLSANRMFLTLRRRFYGFITT